jgi:uncharacterized protein YecE (DUF72 family)
MKFNKLVSLLVEEQKKESSNDEDWFESEGNLSEDQKKILFRELKNFHENDKYIYNEGDLNRLSKKLHAVAKYAKKYLNEKNTPFDNVTVNRNMRELKKYLNKFKKTAKKTQQNRERLSVLYEDIAMILDRYFDVSSGQEQIKSDTSDE